MSREQLESVIADVVTTFEAWEEGATLEQMRSDWDALFADVRYTVGAETETVELESCRAEWITAPDADRSRAILYLHGGGYVLGSIDSHRDMCERLSRAAGARVLALDYRLAPEHPFPAAVEDASAAYRWLLGQGLEPGRIAVAGDSAGGGLTFATLVALRDAGDPLPACATPLSPWVDLEGTGDSMATRADVDPMVGKEMIAQMGETYVQDGNLRDPLAAPLYADLAGLPPLLIQVGGREALFDDAARMAERAREAGVEVTLDEWEEQIHVWQIFASRLEEGEQAIEQLGAFMRRHMA